MVYSDFQIKFENWKAKFASNKRWYDTDVWGNIGAHPLDVLMFDLAELYQSADKNQMLLIEKVPGSRFEWSWQMVLFIRRMAKLLNPSNFDEIIGAGLSISAIASKGDDFRDIIVSLTILKYAADRIGLDARPLFEKAMVNADEILKNILETTINSSKTSIKWVISNFGPNEWVSEMG